MALEDKTEQATPQHREEVRKKGQVAKSAEMNSAIILLTGLATVRAFAPSMMGQLASTEARMLGNLSSFQATPQGVQTLFTDVALTFLRVMAPVLGAIMVAGLVANVAQVGFVFSTQPLMPDLNRVNPLQGLARMFSARSAVELLKSLAKVAVLGSVVWGFLKAEQGTILTLGVVDRLEAGRLAGELVWRLCIRVCSVLLAIAGADYLYQRLQFEKQIRMTKQEVKEEFKRSEGDPLVKSQFRQRHRELAKKRMMQDVPNATVVVTNPTHIAVALRYESGKMAAPVVVAKGQRLVAQRIKQIAKEHHVPTIENKPLARALFKMADIGDPVPVELYQAVAEILAFVYRLRHGVRR